ncbi:ABC transporter G family member 20-like [Wolffia australiana]
MLGNHYDNGGDHVMELQSPPAPHPPSLILSFSNLSYCVKYPERRSFITRPAEGRLGRTTTVLDSVSGEAKEGEIMAVLGPSGSGKSTLMDALANRISKRSLKGSITLNGETLHSNLLKAISSYVLQDDLLFPMLTVEETLMYSAEFRLPKSISTAKKKARVAALLDQLGLAGAAATIIGDEDHRGVSGGERRRVSIGADVIHDPVVLFLDEPTSGLDSTSAFMVVNVLKRIATSGSIVIMSVHQPSHRIVQLFDRLLFLSNGRAVYSGSPSELSKFFLDLGQPTPESESRCEAALDLISKLERKTLLDLSRKLDLAQKQSLKAMAVLPLREAVSASIAKGKLVSGVVDFANPFWVEVAALTRRSFTNIRRSPKLLTTRLMAVAVIGVVLATIFWRLDSSPKGVQERLGFFAFAMSTTFFSCAEALPVFLYDRCVFMRETAYNAYRRSSYVLANCVANFPPLVLLSVTFAGITFFAVGLAGGFSGFFFYFLIILASFWAGSSFVTFVSGVVSNVILGLTVVAASIAYFLLFSGFFITRYRIPVYWRWFHYLSLVKYPFEAVMHNEFDGQGRCLVSGWQVFDESPLQDVPSATKEKLLVAMSEVLKANITGNTCLAWGRDVLRQQGIDEPGKWVCLWITVAWGVFFRVLFYLSLLLGSKNKRR